MRKWLRLLGGGALCAAGWFADSSAAFAQHGIILSGGGPIQRSMGGTGTATAIDAMSGFFWNPATLSALPTNQISFATEFLIPDAHLSSTVAPNALGPGFPPVTLSGTSRSDSGTLILPNFAWAHHVEGSDFTIGIGTLSAAGLSANYPASLTNPVLTPTPPVGMGVGRAYAELQVFQIVPTISWQATERLSIGISPIINMANLRASPLLLAAPNDANGDGIFSYPDGTHSQITWGAGFEVGVYYRTDMAWNFGASYKSPQWFDTFQYNSVNELGLPQEARVRFDLPSITSLGVSYTGFERWILTSDVRYISYRNATGFSDSGYAANGAVRGLGWNDLFVIATGAQYAITDRLALRGGYSYNNNPESSDVAFFNIAAPTIIEHTLYAGASWSLTDQLLLSAAYVHGFQGEVSGPIVLPAGPVPGTNVRSQTSADAAVVGLTYRY